MGNNMRNSHIVTVFVVIIAVTLMISIPIIPATHSLGNGLLVQKYESVSCYLFGWGGVFYNVTAPHSYSSFDILGSCKVYPNVEDSPALIYDWYFTFYDSCNKVAHSYIYRRSLFRYRKNI